MIILNQVKLSKHSVVPACPMWGFAARPCFMSLNYEMQKVAAKFINRNIVMVLHFKIFYFIEMYRKNNICDYPRLSDSTWRKVWQGNCRLLSAAIRRISLAEVIKSNMQTFTAVRNVCCKCSTCCNKMCQTVLDAGV